MTYLSMQNVWWQFLLLIVGSYFTGNINWAIIISKLKKKDIRNIGSGNPGTLNMSRNFGLGVGVLTLVLDILKGVIPTLVGTLAYKNCYFEGTHLEISLLTQVMCGFFVVLGHVFPIVFRFKGGKGIATTIGVFAVCNIWVALIAGALAIIFILFTEIGSMGSFIATTPGGIWTCYSIYEAYINVDGLSQGNVIIAVISNLFVLALIFLTWYAHRKNIQRLIMSEEHPTNWLQMIKESVIKKKVKNKKEQESSQEENK